ncbi:putative monovalent cation/H+ antiporter subunit A [Rhodobium gokarnense]|uniref:Multicomponent Na+:H+ antiporter subunit A n=1 Tax=Rhodobium gokarnense TaxID=364296 RepID=A0ABT3HC05_9HYPH|nr:putative monovalent cation/H+ antiporter subunit A [Rhodobium gokarnense]MCW2307926.1 multicomponent Na+:H+ antiporter subunit A [Rhodobium gokarnense]
MGLSEHDLFLLAVLSPFAAAAVAPFFTRFLGHRAGWLLALVPLGIFALIASHIGEVAHGTNRVIAYDWVPSYGIKLSYYLDGLSSLFAMLVSGIGVFIVIYSGGYLKGHRYLGRFLSFMLLFMGSMLGVVLADNLITLFIYWELTSITSFLLIGFDNNREASRRAALQALLVTGAGGLSLLAAFLLISSSTGITEMSVLNASGDILRDSALYLPIFILVLGGAFTKSAQFPMHFWLPNAMEAPTPVSAYLHSATMVKAGVYLLMRMHPSLGGTELWTTVLPIFGGITLISGTLLAVRQTDLKLMLAYTTVASLGLLVMLTGTSIDAAITGAVLYLFAHSLFKGGLFMVAGTIDHEAGTRDITRLGGLGRAMPITFFAAALAGLSMSGLPPFIGFIAKEVLYDGTFGATTYNWVVTATAVAGNALMLVIAAAVALKPFTGEKVETPKHAHEGPASLWLGPVTLSLIGLGTALFAHTTGEYLIGPMAAAISGGTAEVNLHLIPAHFGAPLVLSIITVALGIAIFLVLDTARGIVAATLKAIGWGPDRGFDQVVRLIVRSAIVITRVIQPGRMQTYMFVVFLFTALALFVPLFAYGEMPEWPEWPALSGSNFYEWAIIAIAVLGVGAVLIARTRLNAIVSLGIQGFAVALIFMLFGAPDLSFTQFMVETLSVVILALVMTRLDLGHHGHRPMPAMIRDGTVAVAVGVGLGLLLLSVTQWPFDARLSEFFTANSRVIAHGRNIVNVIIVDFRGLDTLGEIAVVMTTGLAILALIRIRTRKVEQYDGTKREVRIARTYSGERWGGDVS